MSPVTANRTDFFELVHPKYSPSVLAMCSGFFAVTGAISCISAPKRKSQ